MNTVIKFVLLALLFVSPQTQAENMITIRVNNSYDRVMDSIKGKLVEYDYKVAHIQKCDGGMKSMGYKSDDYRLIFFSKLKEVRALTKKYPQIIPYVPLKIAVIKETNSVILVALNPTSLSPYFKERELHTQFERWENDLRAIFNEMTEEKIISGS